MCFSMIIIRYYWVMPINIVTDDSGRYKHLERIAKSRRQTVQEMWGNMFRNVCRDSNQLNYPVYPNGWIPLIESRDVPPKKVVSVNSLGYRFCIYRGEEGNVFATGAFCPHMGADFSAGGRVSGNCIECPFHAWQFSGETGKCTKIPYSDKIPDFAQVKVWKSCEKNGFVFIWHHAENEPPTWELPCIPEVENSKWVYRGRAEYKVHCHVQESGENAIDVGHFERVHSQFALMGAYLETAGANGQWIQHLWEPQRTVDENISHITNMKFAHKLFFRGLEVPFTKIGIHIQHIGPAVLFLYANTEFGRGVILHCITPEGPFLQRIVQLLYTEPKFKQGMANFYMRMESNMVQRDTIIWNNKMFLKHPLLLKEESLILKYRRWYSQFYSEHSPTLKDIKEKTFEW